MISRFDETRQGLGRVVRAAFAAAAAKGLLPDAEPAAYVVEIPADPKKRRFFHQCRHGERPRDEMRSPENCGGPAGVL